MITNELVTTEISDNISNLCRDYSSFIIWSTGKISQLKDRNWSDLSITEPDTLTLSEIASMHDYVQLTLDNKYVNTNPEISSNRFFHQLSSVMGCNLLNYEPHLIEVLFTNNSEVPIEIPSYSSFNIKNLLLTNPLPVNLLPQSSASTYLVLGSQLIKIYATSQIKNGEFYIEDTLEKSSVSVYGVLHNEILTLVEEPNLIDLISSNLGCYQISCKGDNVYQVKLSPMALLSYDSIILKYTLISKQDLSAGTAISYIDPRIQVVTTRKSTYKEIKRNENLINYYRSLTEINLLDTATKSLDFSLLQGKILWYKSTYTVNITNTRAQFSFITYEDRPLLGSGQSGSQFLKSMKIINSSNGYLLSLEFFFRPPYSLQIYYGNYIITVPRGLEVSVPLVNYDESLKIHLGNSSIGQMFEYISNSSFETLRTEMDVLYDIFSTAYPDYYKSFSFGITTSIRDSLILLTPLYLDLRCQVITSQPSTIINDIINTINKYLFNGQILTSTSVSYPQITTLLLENIPSLRVIKFESKLSRIAVGYSRYLKLDTLSTYKAQIKIVGAIS